MSTSHKASTKPKKTDLSTPAASTTVNAPESGDKVVLSGELAQRVIKIAANYGSSPDVIVRSALIELLNKLKKPSASAPPGTPLAACEALTNFKISEADENALFEIAATRGIDVASHLHCAVARVVKELKTPKPERVEELVSAAFGAGIRCYSSIARQPGITVSAHGLLEHVEFTERQALLYICATLMDHSQQMIAMSFNGFDGSRRTIAHALLLAEAISFRAGEDFVVTDVRDTESRRTDSQLFGLLCDTVESYGEFVACRNECRRQVHAAEDASNLTSAEERLAEAERAVATLRATQPGSPMVAA